MPKTTPEPNFPSLWGRIINIYRPPLTEQNITIDYNIDSSQLEKAEGIMKELQHSIDKVQESLGLKGKGVLSLAQAEKEIFVKTLKSNKAWLDSCRGVFSVFAPNIDPEKAKDFLDRPWWNNLQFGFIEDKYSPAGYKVKASISHSYLDQLTVARNADLSLKFKYKLDPCSVSNVLVTSDNQLVLGHRGGFNFADTIMTIPAGSVEPHLESGREAIFGSYDKEMFEELRFTSEHYESGELVGRMVESLLARERRSYYVFRTKTQLTLEQVTQRWQTAVDKKEHRALVSCDSYPANVLNVIKSKAFDISKANPEKLNQTTPDNHGKILPQCSLSILTSYAQEYGKSWAKGAEKFLDNHYDLTSCFDK